MDKKIPMSQKDLLKEHNPKTGIPHILVHGSLAKRKKEAKEQTAEYKRYKKGRA